MTNETFEKQKAKATRTFSYWEVEGCSWRGRTTKRDGKRVICGHQHKSEKACAKCLKKMKKDRPGNCQNYQVGEIVVLVFKKGK